MNTAKKHHRFEFCVLVAALFSSTFFGASSALADPSPADSSLAASSLADSPNVFLDEDDFLAKTGSDWVRVSEGVYEKRMPSGETVRHGFGPEAIGYFLSSAKRMKQELLEKGPGRDVAAYVRALAEIDDRISGLSASSARAQERKRTGGIATKSACTVGVGIGTGVQCSVQGGGVALASVYFTDFGPCNSAIATATASGSPGTSQTGTGPLACYQARSASAACVGLPGGCLGYAFASIDFTTCELYQFSETTRICGGVIAQ